MDNAKNIVEIVQSITIIAATIFTSWWAHKTFAHKEKISDLKRIIEAIDELHFELFLIQKISKDLRNRSLDQLIDSFIGANKSLVTSLYLKKSERDMLKDHINKIYYISRKTVFEKNDEEWNKNKQEFEKHYKNLREAVQEICEKYT